MGAAGATLLAIGVVDVLLAWVPAHFGSPEWEFGTVSATLNNLPVPTMGFALVLAWSSAGYRRAALMAAVGWSLAVVLFIITCGVFYGLDVPLALRAVQDPVARAGLKAGMIKAVAALLVYGVFHGWAAVFAVRRLRRS